MGAPKNEVMAPMGSVRLPRPFWISKRFASRSNRMTPCVPMIS